jgi:SAM-dependent methyltransferase
LGSGKISDPRFINVDGYPHKNIHYVHRIDRLPFFKNASVDLIYASHCLEHFSYRKTGTILREWCRALKPNGVLRLSIPDFRQLERIYEKSGGDLTRIQEILCGGQDNPFNFHYAVFDEPLLTKELLASGFQVVRRWQADELTAFPDFSVATVEVNGERLPISLNLEAIK